MHPTEPLYFIILVSVESLSSAQLIVSQQERMGAPSTCSWFGLLDWCQGCGGLDLRSIAFGINGQLQFNT